ncbi:hypothetical protein CerSpe_161880 [Prunus speciosa]
MTITLDYVSSILGIHVSGASVALLEDDDDTNFELLVNYLGVTDEEATEQLHQYNDDTLFVDKTGTRVQIVYLRLLRDLDSVVGYSWGFGCLAWLYRQFGQASRSKVKHIARGPTSCTSLDSDRTRPEFLGTRDESCGIFDITPMPGPLTSTIAYFPKLRKKGHETFCRNFSRVSPEK